MSDQFRQAPRWSYLLEPKTLRRPRARYTFMGRYPGLNGKPYYVWQAAIPGDSRCHQISAPVDWFWSKP